MIVFSLREGWKNFTQISSLSLISEIILISTLIVIGAALIWFDFFENWKQNLHSKFEIEVFCKSEIDVEEITSATHQLKRIPYVGDVEFVSQEEAAQRFNRQFDTNINDLLGFNPLPNSWVIKLAQNEDPLLRYEDIISIVDTFSVVDEVVYDGDLLLKMQGLTNKIRNYVMTGVSVLFLISVVLVNLTIRANVTSRKGFIRILVLSGASPGMILGPFITSAVYYAILAALISMSVLYLLALLLSFTIGSTVEVDTSMFIRLLFSGLFITITGSIIVAITKFRKLSSHYV